MKTFLVLLIGFIGFTLTTDVFAGNFCKVIYNRDISEGDLQKQIMKCKNSDNFFLAIHSSFSNAGHLLNTLIAELCDLRKKILIQDPRPGNPYFSSVCEFRRHHKRE